MNFAVVKTLPRGHVSLKRQEASSKIYSKIHSAVNLLLFLYNTSYWFVQPKILKRHLL